MRPGRAIVGAYALVALGGMGATWTIQRQANEIAKLKQENFDTCIDRAIRRSFLVNDLRYLAGEGDEQFVYKLHLEFPQIKCP